ncbi:MAG: bifunctional 3,4-dihydroxy-2-butanone-4-phosphate synthase/GTP cyclohydrolase II [Planctomycetota bacterium]
MPLSPIPEILDELRAGKMIVLVDDESRENEGDLVAVAEHATPEAVNFMARDARGLICLSLTGEACDQLQLEPQAHRNTAQLGTAFTVSVDAHPKFGVTTGVSAHDRSRTIQVAIAPDAQPTDLLRPGHIFPLRARTGGVLVRAGQTEGAVDLARLAGFRPAAVICEIMNDDGTMARRPELEVFCEKHDMKMCSVADLISYRLRQDSLVRRVETVEMPNAWGNFTLHAFATDVDQEPHLALVKGDVTDGEPTLVRVHSECLTGDVFGSRRCDCGDQLAQAMAMIEAEGKGVLLYLRQEGRGIGLLNKLHAYKLQEQGLDTIEANEKLGLPADKRDYGIGSQILRDLGLKKLRILTNNPKKIHGIDGFGLEIVEQLPVAAPENKHNAAYLKTKRDRMGHAL